MISFSRPALQILRQQKHKVFSGDISNQTIVSIDNVQALDIKSNMGDQRPWPEVKTRLFHQKQAFKRLMKKEGGCPSALSKLEDPVYFTLFYAVFTAASLCNVEVASSAVPTLGVPSTRFERVFNTSGYPETL